MIAKAFETMECLEWKCGYLMRRALNMHGWHPNSGRRPKTKRWEQKTKINCSRTFYTTWANRC